MTIKLVKSAETLEQIIEKLDGDVPENVRPISISELIIQCNSAVAKMSQNNDNKILLLNCAMAMRQLVDRLFKFEHPEGVM